MEILFDPFIELAASATALCIYIALLIVRKGTVTSVPKPEIPRPVLTKEGKSENIQTVTAVTEEIIVAPAQVAEFLGDRGTEVTVPKAPAYVSVKERLGKSRTGIFSSIQGLFSSKSKLTPEILEELEYVLVSADLGISTAKRLITQVKEAITKGEDVSEELLLERIQADVERTLSIPNSNALEVVTVSQNAPRICLVVGVNGVGKTTTTAKLAQRLSSQGSKVLLVAADTFRAAAVKQLQTWGERLSVPVVSGAEDAKPQTVVFEAMQRAQQESFDIILIDTAGRLNNKSNLMQELSGVKNAVEKHFPSGVSEVLLVVDATTGQNAVSQAKEFHAAVTLTGLVVTKLDGTPKGGVVVAVTEEIGVPVYYIGIGESAEDLRVFNAREFSEALFSRDEKTVVAESAHAEVRRRKRHAA